MTARAAHDSGPIEKGILHRRPLVTKNDQFARCLPSALVTQSLQQERQLCRPPPTRTPPLLLSKSTRSKKSVGERKGGCRPPMKNRSDPYYLPKCLRRTMYPPRARLGAEVNAIRPRPSNGPSVPDAQPVQILSSWSATYTWPGRMLLHQGLRE